MWLLCDIHWRGASIKPKIFQPGQWVDHFNQWNLSILSCPVLPTYWLLRKKTYTECDLKKKKKTFIFKNIFNKRCIFMSTETYRAQEQTHYKCFKGIIRDKTPAKKKNKTFAAFFKKL